jgi:ubiquinone/menaquinone biosynthesis C-methylase UbiE
MLGSLSFVWQGWGAVERPLGFMLTGVLCVYALRQVRKPSRWGGRPFLWMMNLSHSALTDWGLRQVPVGRNFTILDVGCGGGRTIQKLSALAQEGKVYGVDYAKGSVAASRAKNAKLIGAGQVEIKHASVSQLPFEAGSFDLVTAIETQYYWPDLVNDMREILRVLKPGGTLMVTAESYKKGAYNAVQAPLLRLLGSKNMGVEDQRQLFSAAGYSEIEIVEERARGWICAIGRRRLSAS